MSLIVIKIVPLIIGFILDQLLGDPYNWPHPVRAIGTLIDTIEKYLRKKGSKHEKVSGGILVVIVLIVATLTPTLILIGSYKVHVLLGIAVESIGCYYLLAARCLKDESMKVYHALSAEDIVQARQCVSMIVGRDTACLNQEGIIKATVETIAENTSDGVTAPLFYMLLGGVPLGFFYKAANTMDSMIGYKNERYLKFGFFAAKLDDFLNYIPARITALMMIGAAYIQKLDYKNALRIWKRDRYNHASPNAAQTEAVCAGALRIQLAGDAYYFGKLYPKKTIGDAQCPIEKDHICQANKLMSSTALLVLCIGILLRLGVLIGR